MWISSDFRIIFGKNGQEFINSPSVDNVMRFPDLKSPWLYPVNHERKLFSGRVFEIQYGRIFGVILVIFCLTILSFLAFGTIEGIITLVCLLLTILIFFPILVTPWDLVLSNKRFSARKRFWNIGFFSKTHSFNLEYIETITITPRIKIGIILTGFFIIQQALMFLEFGLSQNLSLPIEVEIILFLLEIFVGDISTPLNSFLFDLLHPILEFLPYLGLSLLIIGGLIFLFGFPHRSELEIRTTGGRIFRLNAGNPRELHTLLASVSRKNRILSSQIDWSWDLPLLENETVTYRTQVGFIDKKTQFLGIIGLLFFLNSLENFTFILNSFSFTTLVIGLLRIFGFLLVINTIRFAKSYVRFAVTNLRLIIQQERNLVSGLWGKRVYTYSELPLSLLQGFTISNFSGISLPGTLLIGTTILFGLLSTYESNDIGWLFISFTLAIVFFLSFFRTFTNISFLASSGTNLTFGYRLPAILSWFSHRIEEKSIRGFVPYEILFPNILNEDNILGLFNACRRVVPESDKSHRDVSHVIKFTHLLDRDEKIVETWRKYGPKAYHRQSILVGFLLAITFMIFLQNNLIPQLKPIFVFISLISITILSLSQLINRYRSLIIVERESTGERRLLFIDEILPRRIARTIGILPQRTITEIKNEAILGLNFRMQIPASAHRLILLLLQLFLSFVALRHIDTMIRHSTIEYHILLNFAEMLIAFVVIIIISRFISELFTLIPRYSLSIQSRFFSLLIPYIKGVNKLSEVL
ncbi:hypothetical protein CEE45_13145 [Candidatus Heimdallarchaeota archaeon B3_Heim]|nr:MAG: hypothetical protein CEE45_13145 [Candidatus Heimdallarchaeota archaeon B3_Heim]